MSYKSILVQLDASDAAQRRLELALRLAKHFDAHQTALLTLFTQASASFYARSKSAENIAEHDKRSAALSGVLERLFKAETARLKVNGEWLPPTSDANTVAPKQGRLVDLIVAGQRNPNDPDSFVDDQFVENLVLSAGRPVLLVPYVGVFPTVGTRVLVAWDGSREATRAIHDALPFLARAKDTTVVTVNALDGELPASRIPGADVATLLARHGANVMTDEIEGVRGVPIGETLLSRASDLSADLIVMGAYGHARWRELVLGGATRSILRSMTVPVLMSH
jgi:nucleotide-binding universal stress UspA family protein